MKKLITGVLLVFFIFLNQTYSNNTQSLSEARNNLLEINKGSSYAARIDRLLDKHKKDESRLLLIEDRMLKISDLLSDKKGKKVEDLRALLQYILLLTQSHLSAIETDIQEQEQQAQEDQENLTEEKKEVVYPGFSSRYNDQNKNVIAGTSAEVYAGGLNAKAEKVEIESMLFTLSGADMTDIKKSISAADLYVGGLKVAEANSGDISFVNATTGEIEFDNIKEFIVPLENVNFRLLIHTQTIGIQKVGQPLLSVQVSDVNITKATGLTTGRDTTVDTNFEIGEIFSIIPGDLQVEVTKALSKDNRELEITLSGDYARNTDQGNGSSLHAIIKKITLNASLNPSDAVYTLRNVDDSSDRVTGVVNGDQISFDLSLFEAKNKRIGESNTETFRISITGTSQSVSLSLPRNGITYDIPGITGADDLEIRNQKFLQLGNRDFD